MAGTVFSPLRGAAETVVVDRSPTPGTASPTTATSRPRTRSCASRSRSSRERGPARRTPRASSRSSSSSRTSSGSATSTPPRPGSLSSDPSNFSHTIDIDKGSDDGIKVGMPVVNGAGLVGRIVQVTPDRSTVQLITDPDFRVGVRLLGSDLATGTAHGRGQGDDLLVDTASSPTSTTRPSPAPRSPRAARSSAPSRTRSRSARSARCARAGGGLTLELVVRPMADTERMQFVTVLLVGAGDVIPPGPLTVAVRTLVRARRRAHAPARGRAGPRVLRRPGRPDAARRDRRRASRPGPTAAPPSCSPPGSPTTSCSRRPSASPPSPTRWWPTWSAACRTRVLRAAWWIPVATATVGEHGRCHPVRRARDGARRRARRLGAAPHRRRRRLLNTIVGARSSCARCAGPPDR